VRVAVKVSPDGSVASVAVEEMPDWALGACVVVALQHAEFAATRTGGGFRYPFAFNKSPR
jgi:hypothetical protein